MRVGGSRADMAAPHQGEVTGVDGKSVSRADRLGEREERSIIEFDHGTAGFAHGMMVCFARQVIGRATVAEMYVGHHAEAFESIEGPIHRREVNAGVGLLGRSGDALGVGVVRRVDECREHRQSGGGDAPARSAQQLDGSGNKVSVGAR